MEWSFSTNSFVKFHGKNKYWSHNMTVLYPNPCYDKVRYKGTAFYTVGPNNLGYEISNNLVCATSKGSDQPAHTQSLIRDFASYLNIL